MKLNGVTYTFPTSDGSASGKVLKTNSAGELSWSSDTDTDTNTTYSAGQGLTLGGTVFRLSGAFSGTSLEIIGTASGRELHAQDLLTSSGGLVVEGATILNSTLRIGGVTYTFPTSDGSASGKVLKTDSAGKLSWSSDTDTDTNTTYSAGQGLTLGGTVFRLSNAFSGTSLEIIGTASGRELHAQDLLTSSGGLVVESSVTFASLAGCSIITTNSDGTLTCGTGDMIDITEGDARYVNVSGDTMTGALTIKKRSGTSTGNILIVDTTGLVYDATNKRVGIGTASPSSELEITSASEALRLRLTTTNATGNAGVAVYNGAAFVGGFAYAEAATSTMGFYGPAGLYAAISMESDDDITLNKGSNATNLVTIKSTGNVGIDTTAPTARLTVSGGVLINSSGYASNDVQMQGDTDSALFFLDASADMVGIGTVTPTTKLEVIGTMSGLVLHAQDLLTSSGGLVVEGAAVFGGTVRLNGVTYTFPTADGSASGKVLKTNSAGQLSWSTDSTGTAAGDPNVNYYVRAGGDTMTGGLLIHSTNDGTKTIDAGLLLEIAGTASGRVLHAQDLLTSSGGLIVEGTSTFNGAAIFGSTLK
ncbi:hypothetical protein COU79_01950, partial [Candidatus Peregrinibacteria bacterium CG10_big_fil_rev_8_21_14_0_10_54_7]